MEDEIIRSIILATLEAQYNVKKAQYNVKKAEWKALNNQGDAAVYWLARSLEAGIDMLDKQISLLRGDTPEPVLLDTCTDEQLEVEINSRGKALSRFTLGDVVSNFYALDLGEDVIEPTTGKCIEILKTALDTPHGAKINESIREQLEELYAY